MGGGEQEEIKQNRQQFGITEILNDDEVEEFEQARAQAMEKFKVPAAPAMPVRSITLVDPESLVGSDSRRAMVASFRSHEGSDAEAGYASDAYFALVHTPVNLPQSNENSECEESSGQRVEKIARRS